MSDKHPPKKPIKFVNPDDLKVESLIWRAGVTVHKCAVCEQILSGWFKYCPECGQAIDWSDDE